MGGGKGNIKAVWKSIKLGRGKEISRLWGRASRWEEGKEISRLWGRVSSLVEGKEDQGYREEYLVWKRG